MVPMCKYKHNNVEICWNVEDNNSFPIFSFKGFFENIYCWPITFIFSQHQLSMMLSNPLLLLIVINYGHLTFTNYKTIYAPPSLKLISPPPPPAVCRFLGVRPLTWRLVRISLRLTFTRLPRVWARFAVVEIVYDVLLSYLNTSVFWEINDGWST